MKSFGLLCPEDPKHGPLLEVDGGLRCVHQAHDGRTKNHPLGPAPATRASFTLAQAEAALAR